jgi:zinc transport system substrate-binding protein
MRYHIIIILLIVPFMVSAQKKFSVLATNSWTAAYARAAGVEQVDQLAPSSLQHPSEYELQISDLEKIKNADLIIYAGYEVVISQIMKSLKLDEKKYLKIETGYTQNQVIEPIRKIAEIAGTVSAANIVIDKLTALFAESRVAVEKAGLKGKPVIVHFFHSGFAKEMGMNPVAVIGPAPLELFNLGELAKKEVALIIDNQHNPIAQPLAGMKKGVRVVELLNFPGSKNTVSLEDVIRYNTLQITLLVTPGEGVR